jgi:hypothetical protein
LRLVACWIVAANNGPGIRTPEREIIKTDAKNKYSLVIKTVAKTSLQ